MRNNTECSKCGGPMDLTRIFSQSYCKACHNEYMRATRRKHSELAPHAKKKANVRSYANVYLKRGKIKKEGCKVCGKPAQMHHPDYEKVLEVVWLCRDHHMLEHGYPQLGENVPKAG